MLVTDRWALERAAEILDPTPWQRTGRPELLPHQIPPSGSWDLWLLEGGRGSGKTEGAASYYAQYMRAHPGARGRIIAPTFSDAVESCVTGPSGLMAVDPGCTFHPSDPGGGKMRWPNGSEALVFGTPTPRDVDRFRAGGNRDLDWWEELAANPMIRVEKADNNAWDQAQFGLRRGPHPHSIASTTPRPSKKYREIRALATTVLTHATLKDNPHTNAEWREKMLAIYEGTRLGRQEIGGELLEDVEGALWTLEMIDADRIAPAHLPENLIKVVVGVDPPGGRTECGIIVAGLAANGHVYVTRDATAENSPSAGTWSKKVIRAYADAKADAVVVEKNYGGDMVTHTIRTVLEERGYPSGENVKIREVNATRGKAVRAEPVQGLYEQHRVHHVGALAKLEDEMTGWVPGESGYSPNRLDALVWDLFDLVISARKTSSAGKMVDARSRGR